MKIFQFITFHTPTGRKLLLIRLDEINGFIMVLDCKYKHLVLFDYGLLNKKIIR